MTSTPAGSSPGPVAIGKLRRAWPLFDAQAARAAEQAALAAHAAHALMERAGLAVARLALALHPHAGSVQVWAGPGNNGGDGLVAARHLHLAGRAVQVTLLADPQRLPADAAAALAQAREAGVPIADYLPAQAQSDLAIDGLLGLGARRPPVGGIAAAIAALRSRAGPVLAIDLPSGLHPDTGMPLGEQAVRATDTLALLTLKPGCHTGQGRDHAGRMWLDTLGVDAAGPTAWLGGAPAQAPRALASHKGSHGDVAVVGGAPGMTGAAWLAARAAAAAGAGRVYCSPLDDDAALLDPGHPELMGRRGWWNAPPAVLAGSTVVCGCGGGGVVREVLPALLAHVQRLVLDADALNAVAGDRSLPPLLRQRASRGLATLLTPHPLEAARLLQSTAAQVQQDRIAAAAALAAATASAVLLKGSGTIVAAPGRLPVINPTGNAALATAGTGDVLAGWAGGLWAQEPQAHPADIAARSAWQHGDAADRWAGAARGAPLRASQLVERMALRAPS